ncbi:MAG: 50S ribosomal protein L25 [Candidatus Pacebacteria bacterium]|nr:50S ribosomal protein L25 [Candidatus Paceibacterota bacterium]
MVVLKIKAEERNTFGKKLNKSRKEGKMPAVLYDSKGNSLSISVSLAEFKKIWNAAGESSLVEIEIGGEKKNALIYDLDKDPVNGEPRHADFYAVDMNKKITANIPLVFEGEAPAVKAGGALVKVLHEVEVESFPSDLPPELQVNLSSLNTFEDKITVKDIVLPKGVEILAEPDEIVALVEEAKEEPIAEEARTLADIEVVGKKEKEEEAAEESGEEKKD